MRHPRAVRRLRARTVALLAVAGSAIAIPLMSTAAADAAGYGWDYISLPTWLGNCPGGGSVRYEYVTIGITWSGNNAGWNNDLVYGEVVVGQDQFVVAQGLCYNGSRSYWGPAVYQTIHPTRSNQTWWIGPAGVTHN